MTANIIALDKKNKEEKKPAETLLKKPVKADDFDIEIDDLSFTKGFEEEIRKLWK